MVDLKINGGNTSMINGEKIIKLGLAQEVLELKQRGWSALKISQYLKQKGFDISDQTIRNFLKWRKRMENVNEMSGEIISEVATRAVDGQPVPSSFKELVKALEHTNMLINTVDGSNEFTQKEKVLILDRLTRTKSYIAVALQRYVDQLDISEILYKLFTTLLEDLKVFFEKNDISEEVARGIIEVIKNVYKNFETKILPSIQNQ
jgi:hypothetical protein